MKFNVSYLIALLCLFLGIATLAQEDESGGIIYDAYTGSINQEEMGVTGSNYYCRTVYCSGVFDAQFINLIGIDWAAGYFAPNQAGSLASGWQFSNNNQIITITLKDNLVWSDGTPITAADVMMSYELGLRADSNHAGENGVAELNNTMQNVEALDDYTIQISFNQGTCNALFSLNRLLRVVPAHIYRDLIDEVGYAELRNHPYFMDLDQIRVVAGSFQLVEVIRDDDGNMTRGIYARNDLYTDNALGYVAPERVVLDGYLPSESNTIEQLFLDEEIAYVVVSPDSVDQFLELSAEDAFQMTSYFGNNYNFLALNRADPTNPQPALDEEGNLIDQGLHPMFGDVQVRRAIARAIDVDRAVEEAYNGYGTRMTSYVLTGAWSYNFNLPPISYQPEMALEMLAEAGWLPENPELPASVDNRLVCRDCLYAREVDESYNGSYFEFDATVELGYFLRVIQAEIASENLADIGITMNVLEVEFPELVAGLVGQTYDASMIALSNPIPYEPDTAQIFGAAADQPGFGLNIASFYNEGYYALEQTARTIPGCGYTERIALYHQMQEIIQDDVPFIFFGTSPVFVAVHNWVEGFEPYQSAPVWNIDTWRVVGNE